MKVLGAAGVEYLPVGGFGDRWRNINILAEPRTAAPPTLALMSGPCREPSLWSVAARTSSRYAPSQRTTPGGCGTGDLARAAGSLHTLLSKKCLQADPSGYFFLRSWPTPKFVWILAPEYGVDPHQLAEDRDQRPRPGERHSVAQGPVGLRRQRAGPERLGLHRRGQM